MTQANREGIVATSQRNIGLINGVADAFAEAAKEFCQHEMLKFTWMRYLPQVSDPHWEGIWKDLVQGIIQKIQLVPIVVSYSNDERLKLIKHSRRPSLKHLDAEGNHLLRDITPKRYISEEYKKRDLDRLKQCGLSVMSMGEIIDRLAADLQHTNSRMMSPTQNEDWHHRLALLLTDCWASNRNDEVNRLRQLELIPTQRGWRSSNSFGSFRPLFFPKIDGIKIPGDLREIYLIEEKAIKSPERKKLYSLLGAEEATTQTIRWSISDRYSSIPDNLTVFDNLAHLEFLYLTHTTNLRNFYGTVCVGVTTKPAWRRPSEEAVYFQDQSPYGPHKLFRENSNDERKKLKVLLAAKDYNSSKFDGSAEGHSMSWTEFLHTCVGVRRHLRLTYVSKGTTKMTLAFKDILQNKPEHLVGLLEYCWYSEGAGITKSLAIIEEIRETDVPINRTYKKPLNEALLPLPKLLKACSEYVKPEDLVFLDIKEPLEDIDAAKWTFLNQHFDVKMAVNFDFYLEILEVIDENNQKAVKVFDLYRKLYMLWTESRDKDGDKEKLM